MTPSASHFDWLSDLSPLFKAQESWFEGTYQRQVSLHAVIGDQTPFAISCGAGLLAEHIRRFRFNPGVIQRLGQVTDARGRSVFHESFLNHLQRLRLRIHVQMAPEGTLLLPGTPLLVVQGSWIQALLLESAFRVLCWESTHYATKAALTHWREKRFSEEDTPAPDSFGFHPAGWQKRALYIGGGATEITHVTPEWPGLTAVANDTGEALAQVRRLFKGEQPLADVWLTDDQEHQASVSRTHIEFYDQVAQGNCAVQMTRYQNLYQPVLLKGHPVLAGSSVDYLRQRTWKQLEAFSAIDLKKYPWGWYGVR
jgi:hypothetical protein